MMKLLSFIAAVAICLMLVIPPRLPVFAIQTSEAISTSGVMGHGILYWHADFEEGSFWDTEDYGYGAGMGGERRLDWDGVTERNVDSFGGASITLETVNVYRGAYSSRNAFTQATVGTCRAEVARWDPTRNQGDAYYGVAMYIPDGFAVPYPSGWTTVMQVSEPIEPWHRIFQLELCEDGGSLHFRVIQNYVGETGWTKLWEAPEPVETGRWYRFIAYVNMSSSGQIQFWIDDELQTSHSGDYSPRNTEYVGPVFRAGLYGMNMPEQYFLVDEMRQASTYALANPAG